jgi:hypothetical protein
MLGSRGGKVKVVVNVSEAERVTDIRDDLLPHLQSFSYGVFSMPPPWNHLPSIKSSARRINRPSSPREFQTQTRK